MSKQTTFLNINQTNNKQNYYVIDIIRVVLAIIILNFHSYFVAVKKYENITVGGGGLACEAFFIISGFFLALSASKEKPISWWRYGIKRVLNLLPMMLLVYIEGIIFSLIMLGIQGQDSFFIPFFAANDQLWFIYFLWLAEIPLYAIFVYCKKRKSFITFLVWLLTFTGYILLMCYTTYLPKSVITINVPDWLCQNLLKACRSFSCLCFGIFIYLLVTKKPIHITSNKVKIMWSIIGILILAPIVYLMFWQYDSPLMFLLIILMFLFLLICFYKIGWISSKMIKQRKIFKFCRLYSLMLYLYHGAIIGFLVNVHIPVDRIAISSICFCTGIIFCLPMYFIAPKFNQVCQNLFAKIALSIKKKKEV